MKLRITFASVIITAWLLYVGVLIPRSWRIESNFILNSSDVADGTSQDLSSSLARSDDPLEDVFNETLGVCSKRMPAAFTPALAGQN